MYVRIGRGGRAGVSFTINDNRYESWIQLHLPFYSTPTTARASSSQTRTLCASASGCLIHSSRGYVCTTLRAVRSWGLSIRSLSQRRQRRMDRRHTMLINECASRNIPWLEAVGIGDDWQERHVAVAGVDDTNARDFCRRYEQNAVVVLDVDAGARLVVAEG